MGSVGLAERDEPLGRACGAAVTRVDLLELPRKFHELWERKGRKSAEEYGQCRRQRSSAAIGSSTSIHFKEPLDGQRTVVLLDIAY